MKDSGVLLSFYHGSRGDQAQQEADLAAEPSCQPIKTLEEASQLMQKSAQKINSASLDFWQFKPLKTGMCYGSWWPIPGNQHNEH